MSSPPSFLTTSFTAAATLLGSVTSQRTASACPPDFSKAATVFAASLPAFQNVMATPAPASANASADARPSRRAPPVTSATFPANGLDARSAMAPFTKEGLYPATPARPGYIQKTVQMGADNYGKTASGLLDFRPCPYSAKSSCIPARDAIFAKS